jgi:ABC-type lipoprotein export system ATPase subunit
MENALAARRHYKYGNYYFLEVHDLVKTYRTPAGDFSALKGINLTIKGGEFVAIIGKSGSGKSTLINMLTGIDTPTSGKVLIRHTAVHLLDEAAKARWRGRELGIVFQFFQLLPTLTLLENVVLPMDLNNSFSRSTRRTRAMELLDMVGIAHAANKLPSEISGGQQQRVAIARALANDPPLIVADEPTGNLDSQTAENIFQLFKQLIAGGKTVIMVTHDEDLAKRVDRTVLIADGMVVNEFLVRALSALTHDQIVEITHHVQTRIYEPGSVVVRQGSVGEEFFVITQGRAEIVLERPGSAPLIFHELKQGEYFGEMALLGDGRRVATVRAAMDSPLNVAAVDRATFDALMQSSPILKAQLESIMVERQRELEEYAP